MSLVGRLDGAWLAAAVVACLLLAGAVLLPLWRMQLVAPQYPEGLAMYAYGYKFSDDPSSPYLDLREINGLNHYIGMKPIEEVTEMQLFIPGVIALGASALAVSAVAWMRRRLQLLTALAFWFFPLFFVADLQYWLYHYGHTMNPEAPLNTGSFTPSVVGTTEVWNFHSETSFEIGFYMMVAAAALITLAPPAARWLRARLARHVEAGASPRLPAVRHTGRGLLAKAIVVGALGSALLPLAPAATQAEGLDAASLQQRIDAAASGDTVYVDGGVFHERIVIDRPLSLVGVGRPVIDGGGNGDVVTIAADDVSFSGFVVRGSGRSISQEPAAIKVVDADGVSLRANRVEDSHFGIHVVNSEHGTIAFNELEMDAAVPMGRRGYGVYLWEVSGTAVHGNVIRNASDGIHLEFSSENGIGENLVTDSRYALHFMYAHSNRIIGNTFRDNLAGAVLMFSHELLLKENELTSNRRGATGVGMLFKDCDDVFAEGNRVLRNKIGMTVEGTPQSVGATAVFMKNLFALNDTGIGAMSNAPITFVENAMIDNTVQVKALGGQLTSGLLPGHGGEMDHSGGSSQHGDVAAPPKGAVWTSSGRGNYWSDYRGYDANGDGVGDRPYQPRPPFAGQLTDDDALRLFQFTLAQQAIDAAAEMFPVYRYQPVIEDAGPLMSPPPGLAPSSNGAVNWGLLVLSLLLLILCGDIAARVLAWDAGGLLKPLRRVTGGGLRGSARG